jgi:predicted MFS family arabinose efflux permease
MMDLVLFCVATFLFWTTLYLYVPVLPAHAEELDAGLVMVGAIIASYGIAQFLLRIPVGVAADFLGRRKPFVTAGLLSASLGAVVMAVADTPWALFAGRTMTGVAGTSWVVSTVFFASYFPQDQTARGIAIISLVNSIAVVAATSIGGQLAERWDTETVFVIAAAIGILGVLFLLPVAEPKMGRHQAPSSRVYLEVATHPFLLLVSLISVFVHFASFATIFSFTLVYAARIGAGAAELGLVTGAFLGAGTLGTLGTMFLVERRGYGGKCSVTFPRTNDRRSWAARERSGRVGRCTVPC